MSDFLPIPHFRQFDEGYCLPACARMVLSYLGLDQSEDEISRILGTKRFGTPIFAIQKLATSDLQVIFQEWAVSELLDRLAVGQSMIVSVRTGFLDYYQEDFAHALVVVGAVEDQSFWVLDPFQPTGPLSVSWNGLLAAWSEFDYQGAILLKKSDV
jgi:ABC-type bacteriocin/lantibiotic exporter with double-glycine peptidase domain